MTRFYIHTNSKAEGPFTIEDLKEKEITKYTPIWHEGLSDWMPAEHVPQLKSLWADSRSPFIYKPATPPPFDKFGYEETLSPRKQVEVAKVYRSNLFWFSIGLLIIVAVVALGYNYFTGNSDASRNATSEAASQLRWEDSVERRVQQEKQTLQLLKDTEIQEAQVENARNYARLNIEKLIRCNKSFDAKRLGGIHNAAISVYNGSDYKIDRADIRVSYVKANGNVFDEQMISITDIQPRSSKRVPASDTKRGTDLNCQLVKITSSDLGLKKNVSIAF